MHRIKMLLYVLLALALSACAATRDRTPLIPAVSQPAQSQQVEQAQQMEYLRDTIKRLRVDVDKNRREMETLRNQLSKLQEQMISSDARPEHASATKQLQHQSDNDNASATDIYLQAFSAFSNNDYVTAIRGFSNFLQQFPRNPYAVNAQFWRAKAYLAQNNLAAARRDFEQVLKHPDNSKSAAALLQLAVIAARSNQPDRERSLLLQLQQQYPASPAAQNVPAHLRALLQ